MRNIPFFSLFVIISHVNAGEFLMLTQIIIAAIMHSLQLIPAERIFILDIPRIFGVKNQIFMPLPTQFFLFYSKTVIISHPFFSPFFICRGSFFGRHKVLHFHLFKFALAEQKLPRTYFIAESLAYLGDTEGNGIHSGSQHVFIIYKNSLRSEE